MSVPSPSLPTPPWSLAVATLLILGGALLCGVLTVIQLHPGSWGCADSGCQQVLSSRYATILGLPLPCLGLLSLGAMLVLSTITALTTRARVRRLGVVTLRTLSVLMSATCLVLLGLQLLRLHALCPYCVAFALLVGLLTYATWRWTGATALGLSRDAVPGEAALMGTVTRPVPIVVAPLVWMLVGALLLGILVSLLLPLSRAQRVVARSDGTRVRMIEFDPVAAGTRDLSRRIEEDCERALLRHRLDHALLSQEALVHHQELPAYLAMLSSQVPPPTSAEIDAAAAAEEHARSPALPSTPAAAPAPAASGDPHSLPGSEPSPAAVDPLLDAASAARRAAISSRLWHLRQQTALRSVVARLRAAAQSVVLLPERALLVQAADWDAAYQLGPRDAPTQLLVVVDAGCGLCALQLRELHRLWHGPWGAASLPSASVGVSSDALANDDAVRLGVLVRTRADDAQGQLLARALQAAQAQEQLWPLLDALIAREDPGSWDLEGVCSLAARLGMNRQRFSDDLASPGLHAEVEHQSQLAARLLGAAPAPLSFLDDRLLGGYAPAPAMAGALATEAAIHADETSFP